MPRPKEGIKPVMLRLHPVRHAQVKEIARLRKKTHNRVMRDLIDEGLERLKILFK